MNDAQRTATNEHADKPNQPANWDDSFFGRFKLRLRMFCIAMIVIGPVLFAMCWEETLAALESNDWPAVDGVITNVVAKNWQDDDGNIKYFGRAVYQYTVGGETYSSDLTDFGPGTKRADRMSALNDVSWYTPGMEVVVYHDPEDPSVAVLVTGVHPVRLFVFVSSIIMTIVGIVVLVISIRQWMTSRASAKEA